MTEICVTFEAVDGANGWKSRVGASFDEADIRRIGRIANCAIFAVRCVQSVPAMLDRCRIAT
jgi:hypothetical protein